ncbi:MAG: type II secretion system minor pseudopilin GspK [Pseudomonadota bacterium]
MRATPRQRGAALLAAMLTVTLVATFAAAALWQQWRSVEVEAAERARTQSSWVLTGALDWARLILREDARASGVVDHLGEPWAVPLQEARLSTFLAADTNNNAAGDSDAENVFLSGDIIDQQSFLNVANLVEAGKVSEGDLRSFTRLFELLGLPQSELGKLAENLRRAEEIATDNPGASQAPLPPQRVEQLAWLGLSQATVAALRPYVAVLPERRGININTASAEVIYAAADGISMAEAQRLVAERERGPFRDLEAAKRLLSRPDTFRANTLMGVGSTYFEVRGRIRLGDSVLEERSLVRRDGAEVKTVYRERGVLDPATFARAAPAR